MEELKRRFAEGDPRFGPVPFWWWSGETVTEERIVWQMSQFRRGGLRNIGIINLAPTGPQYGCAADSPPYASEAWWRLFAVVLREAKRLGMYVWFYDQIGFSGANMLARIVAEKPAYAGYQLRRAGRGEPLPEGSLILHEDVERETVYAAVRQGFNWLDPAASAELRARVHGEMERRFPEELGRTIAGSFQDELPPLPLWTPELDARYRERYGTELGPLLPALFDPVPDAAAIRRRVYRLAAELAEQSWFIPLGEWHRSRGMLIGCDQAGPARRGDPNGAQRLYLDYFRTHRWYNAPGADMDGEIKPHSSMAHLHGGSRVWLEGFHTSGWGGTLEETMHWLLPWFQAGATLYSPHSVYYSTRGGWWEWAPPDTGWRQPYFEHYAVFADTVSRVCALLSEGAHVCDIAVHYPSYAVSGHLSLSDGGATEHPMGVANREPNDKVAHLQRVYRELASGWNRRDQANPGALRRAHLDFDIADDSALAKAVPHGRQLRIAEESFSVLLLCGTTEMDEEARTRVEAWTRQGGLVVGVSVPPEEQTLAGALYVDRAEEALTLIGPWLPRRVEGPGASLHRRTAEADIFLLLPQDGELLGMHEPAREDRPGPGKALYRLYTDRVPELWDPVTGRTEPLSFLREGGCVQVELAFESWPAALVVCTNQAEQPKGQRGETEAVSAAAEADDSVSSYRQLAAALEAPAQHPAPEASSEKGDETAEAPYPLRVENWRVSAVPTLDNRYGDFDLHGPERGLLPVERRMVRVKTEQSGEGEGWQSPAWDDSWWTEHLWSEAAYFRLCRGERFVESESVPVVYSETFGDLSVRPWAGRMGRVPRRFLNLGKAVPGETVWARTYVTAPAEGMYWLRVESNTELAGTVNGEAIRWEGGPEEQTAQLWLKEGPNELLLCAQPLGKGAMRASVEVSPEARPPLPKWLYSRHPNPDSRLTCLLFTPPGELPMRVRMVFAARGRAALLVNGVKVTEHGDYNPYIRQGQEEVDVTALWREGENEIALELPEGKGEVFIDGAAEYAGGAFRPFFTGPDWRDETGAEPGIYHASVLQYAETESLWLTPRSHPLPDVGWLMPESVPQPAPLPLLADPQEIGRPVWLRFPLPVGAHAMTLDCAGEFRVWVDGREAEVNGDRAGFPAQRAGALAAIRVIPEGTKTGAAVLRSPIRFETAQVPGGLGDWRTELHLPHHSGAVEYEAELDAAQELPAGRIDLGHVRGTAEVWLDGRPLGVRLWKPYRFRLGEPLAAGTHKLRVRITSTLGAHYEIGRPTLLAGGSPEMTYWSKGRTEEEAWQPWFASAGLYGPVAVTAEP
ncbi:hypothetical protein ACVNS2_21690 [Paenibacillus caseinilyticus]|uniref:Glycoside hydrolase n=1 Tax=Paenibacillus mucilaginosus K02 TaxID=997761 RepID=R9UPH9_9BACL|nr:hypothetical protein [Paenibacillus mucilaginosus]AGN70732.1 hypothetical protein B2K_39700 [Paenibacillus mucilaginosus K02]